MATLIKKCKCAKDASTKTGKGRIWGKCPHHWTVRWREPGGKAGRQREKTFKGTKAEAEAFGRKMENAKDEGTYIDPNRGKKLFRDYAEAWIRMSFHKRQTEDTYRRHLKNHIYPTFGAKPLQAIRRNEVQAWVKKLSEQTSAHTNKPLSPATIETVYGIFASVINAAVKDDALARTPCVDIRLPEKPKTTIRVLSPEDVTSLAEKVPQRWRALVLVAYGCGLRQGEAFGLCRDRINFLGRKLTVDQQITNTGDKEDGSRGTRPVLASPKTKASNREIPLPQFVIEALSAHFKEYGDKIDAHEDGLVFLTLKGNPMRRDYFNDRIWKPALKKAGLPADTTFHDLRHSFASTALAEGVPITHVSKWLGHASITETVDTYGHLLPESDENLRVAMDTAWRRSNSTGGADIVLTSAQ